MSSLPALARNTGVVNDDTLTLTLTVTALGPSGKKLTSYTGSIVYNTHLQLDLQAELGGSSVESANLRFIQGVSANIPFTGSITGLAPFYQNSVKVLVGANLQTLSFDSYDSQNETADFHFSDNVSSLTPGTIAVNALVGGLPLMTKFNDQAVDFTMAAFPTWLDGATAGFDAATGSYDFNHATPAVVRIAVPTPFR